MDSGGSHWARPWLESCSRPDPVHGRLGFGRRRWQERRSRSRPWSGCWRCCRGTLKMQEITDFLLLTQQENAVFNLPMTPLTAQFNMRVEKFFRRVGFKPMAFGRQAIGDLTLVVDLHAGGVRRSWRRAAGSTSSLRPTGGSSRRRNQNNGHSCFWCKLPGTIEPDPVIHNPIGIVITYLPADHALGRE